jgi:hypothetical protein
MNAPQGSDAWLQARCGKATSSNFSDVLAKGKGIVRAKYLRQVLAERLTGKPTETYRNAHMDRGTEQEPFARMALEAKLGVMVEEVGFIAHEHLPAGASPDGLIGDDGGCEIKSVIPTVQVETIMRGGYPPEHVAQVQGNLWITKRQWWIFGSYCPDMPEHLRLYTFRVERDEAYIATLAVEVMAFLGEVEELYNRLKAIKEHQNAHKA